MPIFAVEPIKFLGRLIRVQEERFAVGEGALLFILKEKIHLHAGRLLKGAVQFHPFPIAATESDWPKFAHAERSKIVEHRSGSPRLCAHAGDIANREAGFDRGFLLAWINLQIPVATVIAYHSYAKLGVLAGDLFETVRVHV